ncbi:hypothetical protein JL720_12082 [Aureococcus anophagefferens]|nr:hypothetical protein JL720_12082 [Aureococcus anophagefferens]
MGSGASIATDPTTICLTARGDDRNARRESGDAMRDLVDEVTEENRVATEYVAQRDVTTIYNACKGLGTDEAALSSIMIGRTKAHLATVDALYREHVGGGKTLASLIQSEVSGNLCKLLLYRSQSKVEFMASMVDVACKGFGTDEELLVDTLVPPSNAELLALREHDEATRDASLMDLMRSELSGEILLFVTKLLAGERDESGDVDEDAAAEAAEKLYEAGEKDWWGTDEAAFVDALLGANPKQCQAINTAYENSHGKSLQKAIKSEFGSDAACLCACFYDGAPDLMARRLVDAMKGFGTDESITDASLVDTLVAELGGLFEGDFRFAVTTLVADADKRGRRLQEQVDALGPVDDDDDDALSARLDLLIQCNDATKELIAYEDALAIRRACHGGWTGLGTDEDELVGILARRTKSQLDRIDAQYRALYDTTLRREIEAETSGDFKDMLVLMQMGEAEGDAFLLDKATRGWGTDEKALIDVLAPKSPARIAATREQFEATYDKSLMDLLDDETSGWFEGDFNRIVKAFLVRSEVDDDADADEGAAEEAAAALHDAMKSCLGTDEATVVETLCGASRAQIAAIKVAYENAQGRSLESALEEDFGGMADDALLALVCPPLDYYCRVLKRAFGSWGTDEAAARYFEKYDEDLDDMLKAKTSGDWGMAVLTWVVGVDPTRGREEEAAAAAAKIEAGEESDEDGSGSEEEEEDADSDESGDDDDDDDDDERKERRRANKRKQKKQRAELKKKAKKDKKLQKQRKDALRREKTRLAREKRLMEDAEAEYGDRLKVPIECAFDEAMYGLQNDCDADDAWREFKKKGFWKGHLLRFKTDDGVFIGALDCRRLLELEGHDPPGKRDKPFTVSAMAYNKCIKRGRPDVLPVAAVVPVCLCGRFRPPLFKKEHKDLKSYWKNPKKGRLDAKAMKDDMGDDEDPYEWLRSHQGADVVIDGREGKVNWGWFSKRYCNGAKVKKAMKRFKKKEWKKRPRLKIKGRKWTPWEYYKKVGFDDGRTVVVKNSLGQFEGVFSEEGYAMVKTKRDGDEPFDAEEAWDEYKGRVDDDPDEAIAVEQISVIKLFRGVEVEDEEDVDSDDEDSDDDRDYGGSDDSDEEEEEEDEEEEDESRRRRAALPRPGPRRRRHHVAPQHEANNKGGPRLG